ncbi:transposase, partial [Candidatus Dojkabacteria bacterium]|nr:transposase [Candidatus Dojkabacteria bacterium]
MNKAFTFRLNPTTEQLDSIKQHAGACRWIWNNMLALNIEKYDIEKKFNFQFDMNRLTTCLRKEYDWLKGINSQSLQQKNKDLDAALKRKISKKSACGFPKFKKKSNNNDSFRVPQFFRLSNKAIYLPKIGWIKWKVNRKLIGKAKSITIKQDLDNWVAVILTELPDIQQKQDFHISEVIGIDVGLKDFCVLSDGTKIDNPKHLQKSEEKLKRKQRELSKKVKGSNQRAAAKHKVAKLHRKIRNKRKDFQWKLVNSITKKYQVVCMENLNIKGMVKNHKLAKAINSVGWGMFKNKLSQKLNELGG